MLRVTQMRAIVTPLVSAFYGSPQSIDVLDYAVGRALDLVKIGHDLLAKWQ